VGTADRVLAIVRYTSDGVPDAAFGHQGILTPGTDWASRRKSADAITSTKVAAMQDGSVVIAAFGSAFEQAWDVRRLAPDGQPDATFGTTGTVRLPLPAEVHDGSLVLAPDGSIICGGTGGYAESWSRAGVMLLERLTPR
jgi:hypothetical protein